MEPRSHAPHESGVDQSREVARIAAFSDGVFAIAITLLALQIQVPAGSAGTVHVAHELADLWPNFLSFLISFFVIGSYWVAHHRLFAVIERYDRRLIWLNLLTLLFIVLMPFATSLVGEHGDQPAAVIAYALTVAACGLASTATAAYALLGHRLCSEKVTRRVALYYIWRGLAVALVFLGSLALLPLGTGATTIAWLAIPAAQSLVRWRFAIKGEA
jgi:uncharacterized membrane protein